MVLLTSNYKLTITNYYSHSIETHKQQKYNIAKLFIDSHNLTMAAELNSGGAWKTPVLAHGGLMTHFWQFFTVTGTCYRNCYTLMFYPVWYVYNKKQYHGIF